MTLALQLIQLLMPTWDNLGMVKIIVYCSMFMVSNQITGVRSTAPISFARLPLPFIDRATDASRKNYKAWVPSEKRGIALTSKKEIILEENSFNYPKKLKFKQFWLFDFRIQEQKYFCIISKTLYPKALLIDTYIQKFLTTLKTRLIVSDVCLLNSF